MNGAADTPPGPSAGAPLGEPLGIFGGTFDPVHVGHLRTGYELMRALGLPELRWIPAGDPAHRGSPRAPAALRLEMLRAATAGQPGFVVDDREIRRAGASYTIDTLVELRVAYPARPLCLLLGMDAFAGLPTWRRWTEIPDLAHLVVAYRPGAARSLPPELAELLAERAVDGTAALRHSLAGRIYLHRVTPLEVSSSALRDLLREGGDPRYLVTDGVRSIIMQTGCYARSESRKPAVATE